MNDDDVLEKLSSAAIEQVLVYVAIIHYISLLFFKKKTRTKKFKN